MKLYRNLMTAAICLAFVAPAYADLSIKEVLIRKQSPNVNVRVTVMNDGATTQKGPVMITLSVRKVGSNTWHKIKTWNDISRVKAGDKIARDFFDENSRELAKLALRHGFEAKAVVIAPGVHDVERTAVYADNTKP
jgi:hypothetical protein